MSNKPYILSESTLHLIQSNEYEVAVLPWGATEAHNFHLPYGTDTMQVDYIAAESARVATEKNAKVMVLPTIPFGVNTGQLPIKFTINMNPSTQFMVLEDIVDSLIQQNIQKLFILNGHGGNDFKHMIRELAPKYPELLMATLNWYQTLDNTEYFDEPGDHAGEMETSNMLQINPDIVLPPNFAGRGESKQFKIKSLNDGSVWTQRDWLQISKDTGIGNPEMASAEKGKRFLKDVTEKIADFLVEFSKADVSDMYE
jgi:creatinine amidohydrolase